MLGHPVRSLLLPYWSNNVKNMGNQQGVGYDRIYKQRVRRFI